MVWFVNNSHFDCTIKMVVERFEKLDELITLLELKLFYFVEIMESQNGLSIQDCKYWSKGCNSTTSHHINDIGLIWV